MGMNHPSPSEPGIFGRALQGGSLQFLKKIYRWFNLTIVQHAIWPLLIAVFAAPQVAVEDTPWDWYIGRLAGPLLATLLALAYIRRAAARGIEETVAPFPAGSRGSGPGRATGALPADRRADHDADRPPAGRTGRRGHQDRAARVLHGDRLSRDQLLDRAARLSERRARHRYRDRRSSRFPGDSAMSCVLAPAPRAATSRSPFWPD